MIPDAEPADAEARVQELFLVEYKPLVSWLISLGTTRVEAEDFASQSFAQLLQSKNLQSVNELRAYLYKIAQNTTINNYKHLAMQQRNGPLLQAENSGDSLSPEPLLMGQERSALLLQGLARLPVRCRTCMALRFWGNLSYPAIVEWFRVGGVRINEKTVRRNIERGVEIIRLQILEAEGTAGEAR